MPEAQATHADDSSASAARRPASSGGTPRPRRLAFATVTTFVAVAIAFGGAAAQAAAAEPPSFELGLGSGVTALAPACAPVPAAECGSVRVPLFRSKPAGPTIDVGYALARHRDAALPTARGTVVFNHGGPEAVIDNAEMWTGLLSDHDLLLIDPRGTGRSHPLDCGLTPLAATHKGFVRGIARCGRTLAGRHVRTPRRRRPTTSRPCARTWASPSSTCTAPLTAPT